LLSGAFVGGDWFATTGFMVGTFTGELFGIAPSGRPHWLRYGWFDRVEAGKVVESYIILDIARLLIETGNWKLAAACAAWRKLVTCTSSAKRHKYP
jgi:hypothetical protein